MAQDEGRFGRINIPKKAWSEKGIRPVISQQIVREYIYAYIAVCPEKGDMTAMILPNANTDMMNIFLKEVSKEFSEYFIIMQVDGAGWHRSINLDIPKNIFFIFQPPYSPELNPVEHIWDDIREKDLSNKYFDTINDVIDTLSDGIKRLLENAKYLASMTYFPHLRVTF